MESNQGDYKKTSIEEEEVLDVVQRFQEMGFDIETNSLIDRDDHAGMRS